MTITYLQEIEAKKESLIAEMNTLEEAAAILYKRGIDDLDLNDEIRKMRCEYNELSDEAQEYKKSVRRQQYYDQKLKASAAFYAGIDAYWQAHDDKTYVPVCRFSAKYEQQSWLKGLKETESNYGCIDAPAFAV